MCKVSRFEGFSMVSMVFLLVFLAESKGITSFSKIFPLTWCILRHLPIRQDYGIGHSPMIFQHHLTFLAAGGELFRDFRRISSSCAETPGGAPAPHYNKPWARQQVWNHDEYSIRRKFRSQTSDNMDRWKAEQGRGREKRKNRREKIRRERVRRKKMQMREKVGKSQNTVFFQWFEAPEGRKVGSLKRRVRSQLARWEMKNYTPLWREAHFQVKI